MSPQLFKASGYQLSDEKTSQFNLVSPFGKATHFVEVDGKAIQSSPVEALWTNNKSEQIFRLSVPAAEIECHTSSAYPDLKSFLGSLWRIKMRQGVQSLRVGFEMELDPQYKMEVSGESGERYDALCLANDKLELCCLNQDSASFWDLARDGKWIPRRQLEFFEGEGDIPTESAEPRPGVYRYEVAFPNIQAGELYQFYTATGMGDRTDDQLVERRVSEWFFPIGWMEF